MNDLVDLLKQHNAVLVAHYYVDSQLQLLAKSSGGIVADSLDMAKFAMQHPATTIIVAGVKFMGETAKILSPNKTVLLLDNNATCSLDEGCKIKDFEPFIANHPDRQVVVYANTSASIKACADWVVTSAIALDVVRHLHQQGEKILWAPDKHLGNYIQQQTQADMIMWNGECVVHHEFKAKQLAKLKTKYPDAAVLVHPESPLEVIAQADVVGSTKKLLDAAINMDNKIFIVATDRGMLFSMQMAAKNKKFILAPTMGDNSTCQACGSCPWMAMNTLNDIKTVLEKQLHEVKLAASIIDKAAIPLKRMVTF